MSLDKIKSKEKNKPSIGLVKSLYHGAGGSLTDDVIELEIKFSEDDVDIETRGMLNIGVKVRFVVQPTKGGEVVAKKIVKIGIQKNAEGIVKLYSPQIILDLLRCQMVDRMRIS